MKADKQTNNKLFLSSLTIFAQLRKKQEITVNEIGNTIKSSQLNFSKNISKLNSKYSSLNITKNEINKTISNRSVSVQPARAESILKINRNKSNNFNNSSILIKENLSISKKLSKRIRTFEIKSQSNYFMKNNMMNPENQEVYRYQFVQADTIMNELIVLDDNLQSLKFIIFSKEAFEIFTKLNIIYQIKLNIATEELIGLLTKTSHLILNDFEDSLHHFFNIDLIPNESFASKIIFENKESETFRENCNLLKKVISVHKSAQQAYDILQKQVDCFCLAPKQFGLVMQFLSRSRMRVSELIFKIKNFIDNNKDDQLSILKYKSAINPLRIIKPKFDLLDKIREDFHTKKNIGNDRSVNLSKILKKEKEDIIKKQSKVKEFKSVFSSKYVDNLIKYIGKDVRNEIFSHCINERFLDRKNRNDDD